MPLSHHKAGPLVAGVDVGGTNIEVGVVDDRRRVIARVKKKTPTGGLQPAPELEFLVSALGDDAGVAGAASLARAMILTG